MNRKRQILSVAPQFRPTPHVANKRKLNDIKAQTTNFNPTLEVNKIDEDTLKDSKNIKVQKINRLYYIDIYTLNLYSFFGIDNLRNSNTFTRVLNNSYYQILKNYNETSKPDDPSNSLNSYEEIINVAKDGYKILNNRLARQVYDRWLSLNKNYQSIIKKIDSAKNEFNSFGKNELRRQVNAYFENFVEKKTPLRNSAYNRVLVNWRVADDNDNNENVTLDTLRIYFEQYGIIKGMVFCINRKGCALIEFATSDAAEAAISGNTTFDASMYVVQDAHKWTIDVTTNNKLKSIYQQIQSVEQKFNIDNNEIVKLQI